MVSTDHFRHELLAQLGRAATHGHIDVLRGVFRQILAAMPCKRSSSQEIRWFLTEPMERG